MKDFLYSPLHRALRLEDEAIRDDALGRRIVAQKQKHFVSTFRHHYPVRLRHYARRLRH